jgi:hypothetical protein
VCVCVCVCVCVSVCDNFQVISLGSEASHRKRQEENVESLD